MSKQENESGYLVRDEPLKPSIISFAVNGVEFVPSATFPTPESLRQFVDERVYAILHGEHSIVDAGHQRRVRQWDEDGTEWRGVLYRVRKED